MNVPEKLWIDLLGLRHEDGQHDPSTGRLDCAGVANVLYARHQMPRDFSDPVAFFRSLHADGWVEVALDDVQPLDVVVSDPEGVGAATHVSVALESGRGAACLSSFDRIGVASVPAWSIKGRMGIYRLTSP